MFIPCMLFTKVASTLSAQPDISLIAIPALATAQVWQAFKTLYVLRRSAILCHCSCPWQATHLEQVNTVMTIGSTCGGDSGGLTDALNRLVQRRRGYEQDLPATLELERRLPCTCSGGHRSPVWGRSSQGGGWVSQAGPLWVAPHEALQLGQNPSSDHGSRHRHPQRCTCFACAAQRRPIGYIHMKASWFTACASVSLWTYLLDQ